LLENKVQNSHGKVQFTFISGLKMQKHLALVSFKGCQGKF